MSFTFNNTLQDPVSQVRSLIADTDESSSNFSDEEITHFLEFNYNDVYLAAAECALRLYVKFAGYARSSAVDDIRIEYHRNADYYKNIYEEMKRLSLKRKSGKRLPFHFGGISRSEFDKTRSDFSTMKPAFTKDTPFFDYENPEKTPLRPNPRWRSE